MQNGKGPQGGCAGFKRWVNYSGHAAYRGCANCERTYDGPACMGWMLNHCVCEMCLAPDMVSKARLTNPLGTLRADEILSYFWGVNQSCKMVLWIFSSAMLALLIMMDSVLIMFVLCSKTLALCAVRMACDRYFIPCFQKKQNRLFACLW